MASPSPVKLMLLLGMDSVKNLDDSSLRKLSWECCVTVYHRLYSLFYQQLLVLKYLSVYSKRWRIQSSVPHIALKGRHGHLWPWLLVESLESLLLHTLKDTNNLDLPSTTLVAPFLSISLVPAHFLVSFGAAQDLVFGPLPFLSIFAPCVISSCLMGLNAIYMLMTHKWNLHFAPLPWIPSPYSLGCLKVILDLTSPNQSSWNPANLLRLHFPPFKKMVFPFTYLIKAESFFLSLPISSSSANLLTLLSK